MAENIGNAYVNIIPKAQGIEGEISQLLGGPAESAGASAGKKAGSKLMDTAKKYLTAAAVGKVLKDAFESGAALEQSFGGLDTIYGDSAGVMKIYAENAAAFGVSANTYAEQAVSMGAALKQAFGGDSMKAMMAADTAIQDMADNAAKMGTPIESIQAAYQGFARGQYTLLDNLKLGYGGTQDEMKRLLADAQAITGVEYDINNLGDVYDAIHAIQGKLGLTGVAAAEASTTLSGSFGAVKASWENLLGALVTGEGLDTALENLSDSAGNFLGNVLGAFENIAPQLPHMIMNLVDIILQQAPQFVEAAVKLIAELGVGLVKAIPDIVRMIPQLMSLVVSAFMEIDWKSLGKDIIDGIIQGLKNAGEALWKALKDLARDAWQLLKDQFKIGSPSKVFADEVGRWIPPGVALGIEDNMAPLNSAITGLADASLGQFDRLTSAGAVSPAAGASAIDYDRLAAAISARPIVIEGDTGKIFRIVNNENKIRTRATNYNVLAGARA